MSMNKQYQIGDKNRWRWFSKRFEEDFVYQACTVDHAMCGDRGITESFGCEPDLTTTIANGDDVCRIRFVRREKK